MWAGTACGGGRKGGRSTEMHGWSHSQHQRGDTAVQYSVIIQHTLMGAHAQSAALPWLIWEFEHRWPNSLGSELLKTQLQGRCIRTNDPRYRYMSRARMKGTYACQQTGWRAQCAYALISVLADECVCTCVPSVWSIRSWGSSGRVLGHVYGWALHRVAVPG